jgi:murein DD-endopeptidase MepM/ murein hydrolase activator NlpD
MNQKLSMKTILKTGDSIKVSPKEGICHIVKKGESLWKISHEYGVSTKTLMAYNNLKEDSLQVKQNILIPWSKAVAKKITQKKSIRKSNSKFIWPLKGRVTSAYGNRIHPLYKRKIFHTGIDVYSRIGTNIKSTMSGTVSYAGWLRGYGKIVIIKHKSGYSSRYAHLSKFAVKKGQKVSQGKIIGTSGRTGNVTGPHLHFEIRRYGLHKDPVKYLKG